MKNKDLESRIKSKGFIKQAYKKEWPTMINNVVSTALATSAAAYATYVAEKMGVDSDAVLASVGTVADLGVYWISLLGQFAYKDRSLMKENGTYVAKKVKKQIAGYFGMFGLVTLSYKALRFAGQYGLQKMDVDPVTASTITQLSLAGLYTLVYPMIKYSVNKITGNKK